MSESEEKAPPWLFYQFLDPDCPPENFKRVVREIGTRIQRGQSASRSPLGKALRTIQFYYPECGGKSPYDCESSGDEAENDDDDCFDFDAEYVKQHGPRKDDQEEDPGDSDDLSDSDEEEKDQQPISNVGNGVAQNGPNPSAPGSAPEVSSSSTPSFSVVEPAEIRQLTPGEEHEAILAEIKLEANRAFAMYPDYTIVDPTISTANRELLRDELVKFLTTTIRISHDERRNIQERLSGKTMWRSATKVYEDGSSDVMIIDLACATMFEDRLIRFRHRLEKLIYETNPMVRIGKGYDRLVAVPTRFYDDPNERCRTIFGHIIPSLPLNPVTKSNYTWLRYWRGTKSEPLQAFLDQILPGVLALPPHKEDDTAEVYAAKLNPTMLSAEMDKATQWIIELLYWVCKELGAKHNTSCFNAMSRMRHPLFNWRVARRDASIAGIAPGESADCVERKCTRLYIRYLEVLMMCLTDSQPAAEIYPDLTAWNEANIEDLCQKIGQPGERIATLIKRYSRPDMKSPDENAVVEAFLQLHPEANLSGVRERIAKTEAMKPTTPMHPLLKLRTNIHGVLGPTIVEVLASMSTPHKVHVSKKCWIHPENWSTLCSLVSFDIQRLLRFPQLFPNTCEKSRLERAAKLWNIYCMQPSGAEKLKQLKFRINQFIIETELAMEPFLEGKLPSHPTTLYASAPGTFKPQRDTSLWSRTLGDGHTGLPLFKWEPTEENIPSTTHIIPPGGKFLLERWDRNYRAQLRQMDLPNPPLVPLQYRFGYIRTATPLSIRQIYQDTIMEEPTLYASLDKLWHDRQHLEGPEHNFLSDINAALSLAVNVETREATALVDGQMDIMFNHFGATAFQWPIERTHDPVMDDDQKEIVDDVLLA